MPKGILVLLVGSADTTEADAYQVLQGESAISEAKTAGVPQRSSAAVEPLEGLRATLRLDVTFYEALAGGWAEQDGAGAFESWYGLYKTRTFRVGVIVAQSDELAVGAQTATDAVLKAFTKPTPYPPTAR